MLSEAERPSRNTPRLLLVPRHADADPERNEGEAESISVFDFRGSGRYWVPHPTRLLRWVGSTRHHTFTPVMLSEAERPSRNTPRLLLVPRHADATLSVMKGKRNPSLYLNFRAHPRNSGCPTLRVFCVGWDEKNHVPRAPRMHRSGSHVALPRSAVNLWRHPRASTCIALPSWKPLLSRGE